MNLVFVTLEGLWIISDKIVDFRFFFKFHSSGLELNYDGACNLYIIKAPN